MENINLKSRDDRFFRAAQSVLKKYKISRQKKLVDGLIVFDITGGSQNYQVKVHPQWHVNPSCSCPDAQHRALTDNRGYCKHVIGTLLQEKDLTFQLLEMFL